jgi:hypothetical protein
MMFEKNVGRNLYIWLGIAGLNEDNNMFFCEFSDPAVKNRNRLW